MNPQQDLILLNALHGQHLFAVWQHNIHNKDGYKDEYDSFLACMAEYRVYVSRHRD